MCFANNNKNLNVKKNNKKKTEHLKKNKNKKSVKGVTFMNFCTPVEPCNHSHGQAYDELGHLLGSYVARVLLVLGLPVSIRCRNRMKS